MYLSGLLKKNNQPLQITQSKKKKNPKQIKNPQQNKKQSPPPKKTQPTSPEKPQCQNRFKICICLKACLRRFKSREEIKYSNLSLVSVLLPDMSEVKVWVFFSAFAEECTHIYVNTYVLGVLFGFWFFLTPSCFQGPPVLCNNEEHGHLSK